MEIWTALLVGVAISCAAYLFVYSKEKKRVLTQRFAEMAYSSSKGMPLYKEMDAKENTRLSSELFLAGVRTAKQRKFFYLILKLSWIVPVVVIAINIISGGFDAKMLMRALALGGMFYFALLLLVRIMKLKRQKKIIKVLPQFLDLILVSMEAGLGFTAALERVMKEMDPKTPLVEEFKIMYHEFLGGLSLSESCDRMEKRCKVPDLSILLGSIVQAEEMGASLGNTLRVTAHDVREKYRERLRTRAHKIPVKILFPMMLIFCNVFILALMPTGYKAMKLLSSTGQAPPASNQRANI